VTEEHSSCSRTAADHSKSSSADKGLQYYLLSFLAAFIACLCCSLPLLALALGLAGASGIKGYMGKYHDLYQFAAVSILLGACVFMWLQKKKGRMSLKGCLFQVALVFSMYGVMVVVMERVLTPWFTEKGISVKMHGNH